VSGDLWCPVMLCRRETPSGRSNTSSSGAEQAWARAQRLTRTSRAAADALASSSDRRGLTRPVRVLRHPGVVLRVIRVVLRLPVLEVHLTARDGGEAIWRAYRANSGIGCIRGFGRSAYRIPPSGVAFQGRAAHGRRNAANRAHRAGLVIEHVSRAQIAGPLEVIAQDSALCPPCEGFSLMASGPMGEPVAVAHVHIDGSVGQLHISVQWPGSALAGLARYALFQRVVRELACLGVEVLMVLDNYFTARPGLREMQRNLGFVPINLRLVRGSSSGGSLTWRSVLGTVLGADRS
jgi:hypothetical protein